MQESNIFRLRQNRFKNPQIHDERFEFIDFNGNFKSDNFEHLQFTNYIKSKEKKIYSQLKDIYVNLTTSCSAFRNDFIADELELTSNSSEKLVRLTNIISLVNFQTISNEDTIIKFKYIPNNEIQFYMKKENDILKLYLIDVYHLGIDAKNKWGIYDLPHRYKINKDYTYDIKNIVLDVEENK